MLHSNVQPILNQGWIPTLRYTNSHLSSETSRVTHQAVNAAGQLSWVRRRMVKGIRFKIDILPRLSFPSLIVLPWTFDSWRAQCISQYDQSQRWKKPNTHRTSNNENIDKNLGITFSNNKNIDVSENIVPLWMNIAHRIGNICNFLAYTYK